MLPKGDAIVLSMLFTKRYVPYVYCLMRSVHRHTDAPFVVLHGANETDGIQEFPYSISTDYLWTRLTGMGRRLFEWDTFREIYRFKFLAWTLTEYSRILLLDADTYVTKNIDEMFSMPLIRDVSAVSACTNTSFNSGVILLKPSISTARRLFSIRTGVKRCEMKITDQSLLNKAFPNWQHMSRSYNFAHHAVFFRQHESNEAHILHVVGEPKFNWCRV